MRPSRAPWPPCLCLAFAVAQLAATRLPEARGADAAQLRGLASRLAPGLASDILSLAPRRQQLLFLPELEVRVEVSAIGPEGLRHVFEPPFPDNTQLGSLLWFAEGRRAAVESAASFPGDDRIVTCRSARTCSVWSVNSGERLGEIHTEHGQYGIELLFPGDRVLMHHGALDPAIWSVGTGQRHCTLSSNMEVDRWEVPPDGKTIAMAGRTGYFYAAVHIWDTGCHGLHEMRPVGTQGAADIAYLDGGAMLAVLWDGGSADTLRIATGERLRTFGDTRAGDTGLPRRLFPLTGARLAVLTPREIAVWNATSGEKLLTLQVSGIEIGGWARSADGGLLAVCDWQGAIAVWSLRTGRLTMSFRPLGHADLRFDDDNWRSACRLDFDSVPPWEENSFGQEH